MKLREITAMLILNSEFDAQGVFNNPHICYPNLKELQSYNAETACKTYSKFPAKED